MSQPDCYNPFTAKVLYPLVVMGLVWTTASTSVQAQCTLICNQQLQVSLNSSGQAVITPALIAPNAAASCPGALTVNLFYPNGYPLPGSTLTCAQIGETMTAQVRHVSSGNSCSGNIDVVDGQPPTVACPEKMVFCFQETDPNVVGFPIMSDNCTTANDLLATYFDHETPFPCSTLHNGFPVSKRIDRSWTVTDAYGNSTQCAQQVWLRQATLSDITFPLHHNGVTLPALACGQDPEDLTLTGEPTIAGLPVGASPACEVGVTYTDQIINFCLPAGYTVIRNWTAVDFCSGTLSSRVQVINVEDVVAPQITPPADATIGTDGFQCTGTVTLPPATATDNCSAVTITAAWEYGNGFGPYHNVPLGDHVVIYRATDACGNTKTATATITVLDNSPPQANCKSNLQVSLLSNGLGLILPATLDAGSLDNCGPVFLSVSRDGVNFTASVPVSCADIPTPLMVTLRVLDAAGIENFCQSEITVRDFLKPFLQCPANATLTCLQDYTILALTGQATASDNCTLQNLVFQDVVNITACNVGSVARTWLATDMAGNTKNCTQQITLNALSTIAVTFPGNVTLNGCSGTASTSPAATGEPSYTGQHCSPISITHIDEVFNIAPPYCFRIVRRWKVIDWCIYEPSNGTAGIWEHAQLINVTDNAAPVLTLPDNVTANADQAGCAAIVSLPDATATDCTNAITITHNSTQAVSGPNASGLYAVGVHTVQFTATDGCGNATAKTMTITVVDQTAPTALCKNGLSVNMGIDSIVVLTATAFDGGSTDGCTPQNELSFYMLPPSFNCQQTGIQLVILNVRDAAGNIGICNTYVDVQDPNHICGGNPPPPHDIEGTIRTPAAVAVAEIPVTVTSENLPEMTACDTAGHYAFADMPGGEVYHVRPANNAFWINGVSTIDLVLISKHILGIEALTSPYKLIAADANHSNSITTFDIVELRKVVLGIKDSVPGNVSWRFVPANFTFPNPTNPWQTAFPEEITIASLDSNQMHADFVGIKVGDINGNALTTDPRSVRDTVFLEIPDLDLPVGKTVDIPVYLPAWQQLEGFQFDLAADPAKITLEGIIMPNNNLLTAANVHLHAEGFLAVSWDNGLRKAGPPDSLLFTVRVTAQQPATARNGLRIKSNRLSPEGYLLDKEDIMTLALHNTTSENKDATVILQNYPNPFCNTTRIPFHMSQPGEVHFTVTDVSGRIVLCTTQTYAAGPQELQLEQFDLPENGAYQFQLQIPGAARQSGMLMRVCD